MGKLKVVRSVQVDPKNAAKFSAALRSGKFKQTKGYLERLDHRGKVKGHCCLGVACRIAMAEGIDLDTHLSQETPTFEPHTIFGQEMGGFPKLMREWIGQPHDINDLVLRIPEYLIGKVGAQREWATVLNDDVGLTFEEIADCVDETVAALTKGKEEG